MHLVALELSQNKSRYKVSFFAYLEEEVCDLFSY